MDGGWVEGDGRGMMGANMPGMLGGMGMGNMNMGGHGPEPAMGWIWELLKTLFILLSSACTDRYLIIQHVYYIFFTSCYFDTFVHSYLHRTSMLFENMISPLSLRYE